jgi:protein-disulfide isomerase
MNARNVLKMLAVGALLLTAAGEAAAPKKAPAAPARTAPAARDWARFVAPTPEGGFRIGNPAAPLKLVEYGSFTCIHCAHFAAEGFPAILRDYVRPGKVSFEFRNFVRDPYDMAGALLARCASPANFFPLAERIFLTREQWIPKLQALTPEQTQQLNALPVPQRMVRFAAIAGFTSLAAQSGIPAARAQQCLTNKAGLDKLVAMRELATNRYSLQATPTFLINGRNSEVYDWPSLQPLLLKPPAG